jgi:biotin operon repressor
MLIDILNITEGTLKVKISNLRKLGFDIENKKEIGYRLEEKI